MIDEKNEEADGASHSDDGLGGFDVMRPVEGQCYGTQYSCGVCDHTGGGIYLLHETPTHWWIGLSTSGQAHYLCDDCKGALFDVQPLVI